MRILEGRQLPYSGDVLQGRCHTCRVAWQWLRKEFGMLRTMKCPNCEGGLHQTVHSLKSIPWKTIRR